MLWLFIWLKYFAPVPRRLRTIGNFSGENPWDGTASTSYSIEEYVMMPKQSRRVVDSKQFARCIGIRAESDGVERMMPEALVTLWQKKAVPPEKLPAVLHAMEPGLMKDDYNLILHQKWQKTAALTLLAVFVVIAGILAFLPVDGERIGAGLAIGISAGFSLLVGAITWAIRQVSVGRRERQIDWITSYLSGNHRRLDGKVKTYFKRFLQIYAIALLAMLVVGAAIGLAAWKFVGSQNTSARTSQSYTPNASTRTLSESLDTQVSLLLTPSEAAHGKVVSLSLPERDRRIRVKIPAGVHDGVRLRLRGHGRTSMNGERPPGDFYINIRVE